MFGTWRWYIEASEDDAEPDAAGQRILLCLDCSSCRSAEKAKGTFVNIPVGETTVTRKVTTHAKTSLRTKDIREARRLFPAALAAVEAHWESLRRGPIELSHRQAVALAGEVRAVFVEGFDENPGEPQVWQDVARRNALVQKGLANEMQVEIDDPLKTQETLEARFLPSFKGVSNPSRSIQNKNGREA